MFPVEMGHKSYYNFNFVQGLMGRSKAIFQCWGKVLVWSPSSQIWLLIWGSCGRLGWGSSQAYNCSKFPPALSDLGHGVPLVLNKRKPESQDVNLTLAAVRIDMDTKPVSWVPVHGDRFVFSFALPNLTFIFPSPILSILFCWFTQLSYTSRSTTYMYEETNEWEHNISFMFE